MLSDLVIKKFDSFFSQFIPSQYRKKDLLLQPEEHSPYVYYIRSGFMRAYRITESGDELTLIILKPHDFFPITYGISNLLNSYYLEAITPLEVLKIPNHLFLAFLKENPDIFYELSTDTLKRFGGLLSRMEYLIVSRAYTKVAATVLACAQDFGEQSGSDIILKVPLTHRDIATLAGITRETTCLEIKKLERKGLISKLGRFLVIKNMKRLEEESFIESAFSLPL